MKLKAFCIKCFAATAALLLTLKVVASIEHDSPLKFDKMDTHDKAHIKEHLDGEVKTADTADMTDEELEFHYFKLHDYDGNNKLDGLEIALALKHHENTDPNDVAGQHSDNPQRMLEKEVIELVDSVLQDEDLNNDGYVDYHEFVSAQRRTADENAPPAPPVPATHAPTPVT